jgi:hypothetical protein
MWPPVGILATLPMAMKGLLEAILPARVDRMQPAQRRAETAG